MHWRRKWQPTLVLLPGRAHGWRSLVGYIPWGRKESDTTERLHFHFLFLNDQCKEIEENNIMGKTRPLFKKIRDTKGTFNAKDGTIKDRKGVHLTETADIKKR